MGNVLRVNEQGAGYAELMRFLSLPRPSGSAAERATVAALRAWLRARDIPHRIQSFTLYPYFFEAIGIWLIVTRPLLVLAVLLRWGWPALAIALVSMVGGTLDIARNWPLVTWPGARRGENILLAFGPPHPTGELILCAHYDTKTELLDHRRRAIFTRNVRPGMVLTVSLGLIGLVDRWLLAQGSAWAEVTFWGGVLLSLPLLFLAWGLGFNMALGRFVSPSQGAVDNGAACAILLMLADRLARGEVPLAHTWVTVALFTGEEQNMQGSRAYVRSRAWSLPTMVVNLEMMGQDGPYVLWEHDGNAFRRVPTSPEVNALVRAAVREVTGSAPQVVDLINSDAFSFLSVGLPATVLGTHDRRWGGGGLHRPTDNLNRVAMGRLPEGVEILVRLTRAYDRFHTLSRSML